MSAFDPFKRWGLPKANHVCFLNQLSWSPKNEFSEAFLWWITPTSLISVKIKSAQITPSSSEQRQWWKWESNSALRLSRLKSRDLARTTFHRRCILYSIENICLDSAFWSLLLIAPLIAILNMRVIIPKWTEQYCLARLDPAVLLYNSEETCGGASVLYNTKDVPSHSWH